MRSMSNIDLGVKFSKQLSFKTIFGYDYIDTKHFEYWSPNSVDGKAVGGLGSRYTYENRNLTSSSTLRYANTWNDVHNFDILGGFEVTEDETDNQMAHPAKYLAPESYPTWLPATIITTINTICLPVSVGMVLPAWEPIIAGRISGPYLAHGASVARISLIVL